MLLLYVRTVTNRDETHYRGRRTRTAVGVVVVVPAVVPSVMLCGNTYLVYFFEVITAVGGVVLAACGGCFPDDGLWLRMF